VRDVPAGYRRLNLPGEFPALIGPFHYRWDDGHLVIGLRVAARHTNARGVAHGGLLAFLSDAQLAVGLTAQVPLERFLPTINLNCDFVAPARLGTWIEGRTTILRTTRNLIFGQCHITGADGQVIVRANGLLKIPPAGDAGFPLRDLLS